MANSITLEEYSRRLADTGRFRKLLKKGSTTVALDAERRAKVLATTRLRVRTGRLRSSIRGFVRGGDETAPLEIGVQAGGQRGIPYAAIQELGGEIRPKQSRYLAIPLQAARTAAGVGRFASPRDVPGLFTFRSGAGNLIMAVKDGKGGLIPMFVLKARVRITGKHYLRDALIAAAKAHMPDVAFDAVRLTVETEGGTGGI